MSDAPKYLPALDGYDWEEAFRYASGEWATGTGRETQKAEPFAREDVAEVLGIAEGENDGPDWLCHGRLKNGRFFFLSAGCDYTGWDCRAGGRAYIAESPGVLRQMAMTVDDRKRMGFTEEA